MVQSTPQPNWRDIVYGDFRPKLWTPQPKWHYVFVNVVWSKAMDKPGCLLVLVQIYLLCNLKHVIIIICIRRRFWSIVVDTLAIMAVRCKVRLVRVGSARPTCICNTCA